MNYYNEWDKQLAEWLRNLIQAGLLPEGDVDDRSITEVKGTDLAGYTQCHFFAGIGGWPLALELAGWPATRPVWTGSCPCQPFSNAGRQGGTDDPRHLWPHFRRLIEESKPRPAIVFGEQVASKSGRAWLAGVRTDLEELGYGVGGADLCGASIGSPHIRQRLYWVADSHGDRAERCESQHREGGRAEQSIQDPVGLADATSEGRQRRGTGEPWLDTQSEEAISGWVRSREPDIGVAHAERCRLMDSEPHNGEHHAEGRPQRNTPLNERKPSKGRSHEGGVGDTIEQGLEGLPWASTSGHESRWVKEEPHRPTATPSTDDTSTYGWVADTELNAERPRQRAGQPQYADGQQDDRNPVRDDPGNGISSATPWDGAVWLQCLDNRERRIEPRIRPLADGVPGRVVKLRAYGNAIIPQVGAEFVTAFMEIEEGRLA